MILANNYVESFQDMASIAKNLGGDILTEDHPQRLEVVLGVQDLEKGLHHGFVGYDD